MWEFYQELQSGNGPVFLKLDHLAEETIQTIEQILHTNERRAAAAFMPGAAPITAARWSRCTSPRSVSAAACASGVYVNARAETTVPATRPATWRPSTTHARRIHVRLVCRPERGRLRGRRACRWTTNRSPPNAPVCLRRLRERGLAPAQVEYKLRRMVNDYLQPPKVTRKMEIGLQRFDEITEDIEEIKANHPHELMRAAEVRAIRDCAEMAARASLFRTESRWGCTTTASTFRIATTPNGSATPGCASDANGAMHSEKRPVEPYVVPLADDERGAHTNLRIREPARSAALFDEPAYAPYPARHLPAQQRTRDDRREPRIADKGCTVASTYARSTCSRST